MFEEIERRPFVYPQIFQLTLGGGWKVNFDLVGELAHQMP